MKIYIEFTKDKLRVKIGNEEIAVEINDNFYLSLPGTESYYMFTDSKTTDRLKDLINRQRTLLSPLRKIFYFPFRNEVLAVIDHDVQQLVTIGQIHDYATLFLDARIIAVIPKPIGFDSTNLENINTIGNKYINRGRVKGDIIISHID